LATPVALDARRPRLGLRAREELVGYLLILPWIIGVSIFYLGSVAYSLYLSFYDSNMFHTHNFIGLANYQTLFFSDPLWLKAVINTFYYTAVSVPLSIMLAFAIALLLNQHILGLSVWRTVYYLPSVVSGVAVSVLWAWIYHPDIGLINAALSAVGIEGPAWLVNETTAMPALIFMSLWAVGSSMIIFLAGLQGVPVHLYEAAKIDGANEWRCFWNITVPMMTPTLFFALLTGIIGSFQVFTQAYILTEGGPNNATLTYVMLIYKKSYLQFHFGYGAALAWVLFAIILLFTLLAVKVTNNLVYYEGGAKA
jgi:multiple sugar transport system permease protein